MGKKIMLLITGICLALLLYGCKPSLKKCTGSLAIKINIDQSIGVRTLEPDTKMKCYYYVIVGNGPHEETFTQRIDDAYYEKDNLATGEWTIQVDGFNEDKVKIVTDTQNTTIIEKKATKVFFTLQPLNGQGRLTLNLVWNEGYFANPSISAILNSVEETETDISDQFIINNNNAFLDYPLTAGYYELSLELKDGDEKVWGEPKAVRIIANQATEGVLELDLQKLPGAGIITDADLIFDLTNNYQQPIKVSFTGIPLDWGTPSLELGQDMDITVHTSEEVDSYTWFLDGEALTENQQTITLGRELPIGRYRLDCLVKKEDIFSSGGFYFSLQPGITDVEIIDLIEPIDGMVWDGTYFWGYSSSSVVNDPVKICKFNSQLQLLEEHVIEDFKEWGSSMSWDGTYFWIVTSSDMIHKVDRNFNLVASIPAPFYTYAISCEGNNIWLGTITNGIVKCDQNLNIIETFTNPIDSIDDMLWANDFLWVIDQSFFPYIHLCSKSLTRLFMHDFFKHIPDIDDRIYFSAICYDGSNLWVFSTEPARAYKINGIQIG